MSQIATLSLPSGRFQGDYQNLYPRKEEEVSGHHEKQHSVKFCYLIVWIASGWGQIYHNTQSFQPPQHINFTQGPEFGPNTFQLYHTLQQFSNLKTFFLLITYAFFIYSWNFPAPLQLHCQAPFLLPSRDTTFPPSVQSCFTNHLPLLHTLPSRQWFYTLHWGDRKRYTNLFPSSYEIQCVSSQN